MFCFHFLLLIRVPIKHIVVSAHAQLFPLIITVGNTFPLVISVGNTSPLVTTVGNRFRLVITVDNTFPPLITVRKNNGSSFFLKKRGISEMSSMGHRKKIVTIH